jgi:hypothetical protein
VGFHQSAPLRAGQVLSLTRRFSAVFCGARDQVPDTLDRTGGSFNNYSPKSDVDVMMDRARKLPGPGTGLDCRDDDA